MIKKTVGSSENKENRHGWIPKHGGRPEAQVTYKEKPLDRHKRTHFRAALNTICCLHFDLLFSLRLSVRRVFFCALAEY